MAAHTVHMLKPGQPRHFIRQWRKHRGLTLEKLAERIGMTHQNLGKIERFKVPVNDELLDLLADELNTDRGSLLIRDPSKVDALWSIWDNAQRLSPDGQRRAAKLIAALEEDEPKTGTKG